MELGDDNDVQVPEGVFWADFIKTVRHRPRARLKVALDYLPLPAAYQEACIALRAIVRKSRKAGEPFEAELLQLYRLLAESDFLHHVPYVNEIGGPGFNFAASIPRHIVDGLRMPYPEIGFEKLDVSTTETKWFVEAWGRPRQHLSTHDYHGDVWAKAVLLYQRRKEEEEKRSQASWRALLSASTPEECDAAAAELERGSAELEGRLSAWEGKVFGEETSGWEESSPLLEQDQTQASPRIPPPARPSQ